MIWTQKKLDRFIYLKKIGIPLDEIAKELGCTSSAAQTKSAELIKKGLVPKSPRGGKRTKKEDNKMDTNEKIETAKVTEDFAYTDYTAEAKTETQSEVTQAKQEVVEAADLLKKKTDSLQAAEPESADNVNEPVKANPNADATLNNAYATLNNAYATFNNAYATLNNACATFNNADPTNDNANAPTDNANAPTDNANAPTDNADAPTDNANVPTATPTDHTADPRKNVSRADILDYALFAVNGIRQKQYGKPEDNFAVIAKLWTAYKGESFTPLDVAMMMALLKIARIRTGVGTVDSFVDLAGYAACAGEIAGRS